MHDAHKAQASEIIRLHDTYLLNMAWPDKYEMQYQASDSLFKFGVNSYLLLYTN